ncbi:DUF2520 domain-containing protein [Selenomonadales bacterium OttesenSCG-928-I06]|nr:DUF2520 domain-containing protein [Selenomonadales bacterium OttesenSCG-928-I06]
MLNSGIAIIGAGKVGNALARVFFENGFKVAGIGSKTETSAKELAERVRSIYSTDLSEITKKADIVFLTTTDNAIVNTCRQIAENGGFRKNQFVFHTCGAMSAEVLKDAEECGAYIASFHPLHSFAHKDVTKEDLINIYYAIDGSVEAVELAKKIVEVLGGKTIFIDPENRALYHAAACFASNYTVALASAASQILSCCNLTSKEATEALLPLYKGTLENIAKLGVDKALTGPISRGDNQTVLEHVNKMRENNSYDEMKLYQSLGSYALKIAEKNRTITIEEKKELEKTLKIEGDFNE